MTRASQIAHIKAMVNRLESKSQAEPDYLGSLNIAETSLGIKRRSGDRYYVAGTLSGIRAGPLALNLAGNTIYAAPLYIGDPIHIDQVHFVVTTGAAGNCRIGLYDTGDAEGLVPGRRLFDFGEVSAASAGNKTITVTPRQTIPRGLSWIVLASNTTATVNGLSPGDAWALLGNTIGFAAVGYGWTAGFTYAALPEVFPATALAISGSIPCLAVRVVK